MQSIEEGKQYLRSNWEKGVICPCCKQFVKLWKYQIHSTMARLLIALYELSMYEEYHHINDLWIKIGNKSMGGDFAKLTLWKLIEPKPKELGLNKRATGYWKITELGKNFVKNKVRVAKILYMFNGYKDREEDSVTIIDVLKKKFDYYELMINIAHVDYRSAKQIGMDLHEEN